MRKKFAIIVIALILIPTFSIGFIAPVHATHTAKVYWVDDGNGVKLDDKTKAFSGTLAGGFKAKFAVYNLDTSNDSITSVRVVIDRNSTYGVLFHFVAGYVYYNQTGARVPNWTADPTEFDNKGWPGTVIFKALPEGSESTPLVPGDTYWFEMIFIEGPSSCNYRNALTVYTIDPGRIGDPETELSETLSIIIDNEIPIISTIPTNGSTAYGLLEPCGYHYMWINITAYDAPTHDTGLWNYSIYFDNLPFDSGLINLTRGIKWNYSNRVRTRDGWNLSAGTHNFTVTVWDMVKNKATVLVTFTYVPPPVPLTINPSSGFATLQTQVIDKATGLVASSQYTYKAKTLGTLVTLKGIQFGANLPVEVRVYIPTYHSYNRTYGTYNILVNITKTDSQGSFTATFIFPEAPAGIYNVTAKTSVMECAIWFEVKPEIIYEPDEVIGPALITVKATGFTAQTTGSWLFILPDALQGVNTQIDRWWYIDGNGTLRNALNSYGMMCEPPQTVDTTLNWPFMEPGTYTVEIKHVNGNYWDGQKKAWKPTPCFAGSNTIKVKDWTGDILDAANAAKSSADAAKSSADAAKSSADSAKSSADAAKSSADAAKSSADSAKSSADAAKSAAEGVKDAADKAKAAAEGLTIPVYLAVILSLIAAIAAAACTVLVYRKIA